jgi:hypothetical protein
MYSNVGMKDIHHMCPFRCDAAAAAAHPV